MSEEKSPEALTPEEASERKKRSAERILIAQLAESLQLAVATINAIDAELAFFRGIPTVSNARGLVRKWRKLNSTVQLVKQKEDKNDSLPDRVD